MAAPTTTDHKNHKNGFNLSRAEVDRLESALKDETFVKLLTDYARELADPAKKAVYEAEIAQLEAERGYDVSFIHPKPGYVIKVIFITVFCSNFFDYLAVNTYKLFKNVNFF